MVVGLGPDLPEIQPWPSHPMGHCPAHLHPQVLDCSVLWACDQHHTPLKLCGLPPIVTYTVLLDASVSFHLNEEDISQIKRNEEK